MTIYDMKCKSKILIQEKIEVGELHVVCYKLAGKSLRPAIFAEASVVPNVIGMIVSSFETECSTHAPIVPQSPASLTSCLF